ncbi:MAG TPA: flagellar biosynthetic protein FliO, partial [Buchnera sp. (in: enterobacteria)]|nr:flagellar biosynthetic protein FliO [Buchnera sp. (in: enterobacteria)]
MKNDIIQHVSSTLPNFMIEKTFSQVSLTLLQIIVLIILLSWIFKKIFLIQPYEKNSFIKIISKTSIGSNESIVVIELQDIRLVLGLTKNRITYLHTLTISKSEILEKKNL